MLYLAGGCTLSEGLSCPSPPPPSSRGKAAGHALGTVPHASRAAAARAGTQHEHAVGDPRFLMERGRQAAGVHLQAPWLTVPAPEQPSGRQEPGPPWDLCCWPVSRVDASFSVPGFFYLRKCDNEHRVLHKALMDVRLHPGAQESQAWL